MNLFNKLSIKIKILLISFFAIFYFCVFAISNYYFSSKVKNTFVQMNSTELHIKNTIEHLIKDVLNLNKLVITTSVSDEVTKESLQTSKNLDKKITKELEELKVIAQKENKEELKKLIILVEKRYKSFYKIASNIHLTFKEDFDDGIDEIIGLDAISSKMEKELSQLTQLSEKNLSNKITNIVDLMNFTNNVIILIAVVVCILFIIFLCNFY